MADAGLFVGWGSVIPGREDKSLEVFGDTLAFYGEAQSSGAIESFEVALLNPHGGGLAGFVLVRGSDDQLAQFRNGDRFRRLVAQASMVVEDFGVIDASLGDEVARQISTFQEAIGAVA